MKFDLYEDLSNLSSTVDKIIASLSNADEDANFCERFKRKIVTIITGIPTNSNNSDSLDLTWHFDLQCAKKHAHRNQENELPVSVNEKSCAISSVNKRRKLSNTGVNGSKICKCKTNLHESFKKSPLPFTNLKCKFDKGELNYVECNSSETFPRTFKRTVNSGKKLPNSAKSSEQHVDINFKKKEFRNNDRILPDINEKTGKCYTLKETMTVSTKLKKSCTDNADLSSEMVSCRNCDCSKEIENGSNHDMDVNKMRSSLVDNNTCNGQRDKRFSQFTQNSAFSSGYYLTRKNGSYRERGSKGLNYQRNSLSDCTINENVGTSKEYEYSKKVRFLNCSPLVHSNKGVNTKDEAETGWPINNSHRPLEGRNDDFIIKNFSDSFKSANYDSEGRNISNNFEDIVLYEERADNNIDKEKKRNIGNSKLSPFSVQLKTKMEQSHFSFSSKGKESNSLGYVLRKSDSTSISTPKDAASKNFKNKSLYLKPVKNKPQKRINCFRSYNFESKSLKQKKKLYQQKLKDFKIIAYKPSGSHCALKGNVAKKLEIKRCFKSPSETKRVREKRKLGDKSMKFTLERDTQLGEKRKENIRYSEEKRIRKLKYHDEVLKLKKKTEMRKKLRSGQSSKPEVMTRNIDAKVNRRSAESSGRKIALDHHTDDTRTAARRRYQKAFQNIETNRYKIKANDEISKNSSNLTNKSKPQNLFSAKNSAYAKGRKDISEQRAKNKTPNCSSPSFSAVSNDVLNANLKCKHPNNDELEQVTPDINLSHFKLPSRVLFNEINKMRSNHAREAHFKKAPVMDSSDYKLSMQPKVVLQEIVQCNKRPADSSGIAMKICKKARKSIEFKLQPTTPPLTPSPDSKNEPPTLSSSLADEFSCFEKKTIPMWAKGIYFKQALLKQHYDKPSAVEEIFGTSKCTVDLIDMFNTENPKFHFRTSSANWS